MIPICPVECSIERIWYRLSPPTPKALDVSWGGQSQKSHSTQLPLPKQIRYTDRTNKFRVYNTVLMILPPFLCQSISLPCFFLSNVHRRESEEPIRSACRRGCHCQEALRLQPYNVYCLDFFFLCDAVSLALVSWADVWWLILITIPLDNRMFLRKGPTVSFCEARVKAFWNRNGFGAKQNIYLHENVLELFLNRGKRGSSLLSQRFQRLTYRKIWSISVRRRRRMRIEETQIRLW